MKAVKCKDGHLSFISSLESQLFNKIDFDKFLDINTLDERTLHIAEEMYKQNVIRKITTKEGKVGYKTYPQKTQV
tara:strand:+ start:1032 stop:1256 length:225 start_codon:yes stop_codon:yes gene_type:complete